MQEGHGIQTLLMTDVVGSTRLWSAHPALMPAAIERLEALADAAVGGAGGKVVKSRGEGDSLFCVLPHPAAAARAALALVRALQDEPWPEGVALRVRAAVHCGAAQSRGEDLYGPMPNRCARLREVGHPGQILLSAAARTQISASEGLSLLDLGRHRLRDLDETEWVYQLVAEGLPAGFPPLRSLNTLRNNLPSQLTRFFGRDALRKDLVARLDEDRITTLTGAGGCGKTRLQLQLGADTIDAYPDGVWFVEMDGLVTPSGILRAIGEACGLRDLPDTDDPKPLIEGLKGRDRMLLLLDNAEMALAVVGRVVSALLKSLPEVRIVVSSREPLRLRGERVHRVPPLTVPPAGCDEPGAVAATEAGALFLDRATFALPEFALRPSNARAVSEIVRRLDGIPLCLEMAAVHVGYLSADQIAARLKDRFALLEADGADVPSRHRTMRETIRWQVDTLDEADRTLLQRLAAFAGGFDLEAAEFVGCGPPLDEDGVVRGLRRLVEKSLVVAHSDGPETRYRLLGTIAQFAAEDAGGGTRAAQPTLALWAVGLARACYEGINGPQRQRWMARADEAEASLRRALEWALVEGDEIACELCLCLTRYWYYRGLYVEARGFLERAARIATHPDVRLDLVNAIAVFCSAVGDHAGAAGALSEALAGEVPSAMQAKMWANLGNAQSETGDLEEALASFERSYEAAMRDGDAFGYSLTARYNAALAMGDLNRVPEAIGLLTQAADEFAQKGNATERAKCYAALSEMAARGGDVNGSARWLGLAASDPDADAQAQHLVDVALSAAFIAAERDQSEQAAYLYGAILQLLRETSGFVPKRNHGFLDAVQNYVERSGREPELRNRPQSELLRACLEQARAGSPAD